MIIMKRTEEANLFLFRQNQKVNVAIVSEN